MSNALKQQAARFRKYAEKALTLREDVSMTEIIPVTAGDWEVYWHTGHRGRFIHIPERDYSNIMCLYCLFIAEYLEGEQS